jgi:hypothetical protein
MSPIRLFLISLVLVSLLPAVNARAQARQPSQIQWPEAHLTCSPHGNTLRCFLDAGGTIVLDGFESLSPQGNVAIVRSRGKWSLIDTKGRNILPAEYDYIHRFEGEGPALFHLSEFGGEGHSSLEGACDATGRIIVPVKYQDVRYVPSSRRFIVKRSERSSLLDAEGRTLSGVALDNIDEPLGNEKFPLWIVRQGKKSGAIDPASGHLTIPLGDWSLQGHGPFIIAEQEDDSQGAFDLQGKPVVPITEGQQVSWWDGGHLLIVNTGSGDQDDSYALNARLNEIIPHHHYAVMKPYGDRLAVYDGTHWGLLSSQLAIVAPLQYDRLNSLHTGPHSLFVFGTASQGDNFKYGVIDSDGKTIISSAWDSINLTLLNPPGTATHAERMPDAPAYYVVSKDQKLGVFSSTGALLLPVEYDEIEPVDQEDSRLVAIRNGHAELVDGWTGKVLLPPDYEMLKLLDGYDNLLLARKAGKLGILTMAGTTVVPFVYDAFIDSDALSHTVLLAQNKQTVKLTLTRSVNDLWTANSSSKELLGKPCDSNPVVNLIHPPVTECYLPEHFSTEQQVLNAFHHGELREATWPSLQISDKQAFLFLGEFPSARLPLLPNILPLCQTAKGFEILLTSKGSKATTQLCQDVSQHRLTFSHSNSKTLYCKECAALDLPDIWVGHEN